MADETKPKTKPAALSASTVPGIIYEVLSSNQLTSTLASVVDIVNAIGGSGKRLLAIELLSAYQESLNTALLEIAKRLQELEQDGKPAVVTPSDLLALSAVVNQSGNRIIRETAGKD